MVPFHSLSKEHWSWEGIHTSAHDCEHALTWAPKPQLDGADLMRTVFIGCASAATLWMSSLLTSSSADSKAVFRCLARLELVVDVIHILVNVLELRFGG